MKKPLISVRHQATDLVHTARERGVDASYLQDEVDGIMDRIEDLQAKLDDRYSELQSAATAIAQFNEILRNLVQDLNALEEEIEQIKPSGRDTKTILEQIENTQMLKNKISKVSDEVEKSIARVENLVDTGFSMDTAAIREQTELLKRQLSKLDDRLHCREKELNEVFYKLQQFWQLQTKVVNDIDEVSQEISKFKSVGSEVEFIRIQQKDFRALKINQVEPISRAVQECNSLGQMLTQTAGRDINTCSIEKDLEKMNEKWNNLKEKVRFYTSDSKLIHAWVHGPFKINCFVFCGKF